MLFSIILIISSSISLASASEIVLDDDGHSELDGISIENFNQKSYSSSNVLEKALNCQNSESSKLALNETSSKNRVFKYSHPLNLKSDYENTYLDSDSNSNNEEILNESFIINQNNLSSYFDEEGVLKTEYGGSILVFEGDFEEKGILTIDKNKTRITGINSTFYNTVFSLEGSEIILANLDFVLDESFPENHNSGIYIESDNITVYNTTMNYTSPTDVNAIGIYSYDNMGLSLVNNTINYIGHADYTGYNYGIMLNYCNDAYVHGNVINADLPLREVDWSYGIYGQGLSLCRWRML